MVRIRITRGDRSEEHTVSDIEHVTWEGIVTDEPDSILIRGLDPSETDLLPASLTWMSGSMADSRSDDIDDFPCVFVPDHCPIEIDVTEQIAGDFPDHDVPGDDEIDWGEFNRFFDVDGVRISEDGRYTCEACDQMLHPTGEFADRTPGAWGRYSIWRCPACEDRFEI